MVFSDKTFCCVFGKWVLRGTRFYNNAAKNLGTMGVLCRGFGFLLVLERHDRSGRCCKSALYVNVIFYSKKFVRAEVCAEDWQSRIR